MKVYISDTVTYWPQGSSSHTVCWFHLIFNAMLKYTSISPYLMHWDICCNKKYDYFLKCIQVKILTGPNELCLMAFLSGDAYLL